MSNIERIHEVRATGYEALGYKDFRTTIEFDYSSKDMRPYERHIEHRLHCTLATHFYTPPNQHEIYRRQKELAVEQIKRALFSEPLGILESIYRITDDRAVHMALHRLKESLQIKYHDQ